MYKLTSSSRISGKTFYLATKVQAEAIRTNRGQIVLMLAPNKENRTIIVYPEDSITEIIERLRKGDSNMLHDRKYDIIDNQLVKRVGGVPVPNDEPLFILRACDINALPALLGYLMLCDALEQKEMVIRSVKDFKEFARKYPGRMAEPEP